MINYNCNEYINNKKTIHKSNSCFDIRNLSHKSECVDRYIVFDEYKLHITLDDFKNYENYYANTPLVQQFKSLAIQGIINKDKAQKEKNRNMSNTKITKYEANELTKLNNDIFVNKSKNKKRIKKVNNASKNNKKMIKTHSPSEFINEIFHEFQIEPDLSLIDKYIQISTQIKYNIDSYSHFADSTPPSSLYNTFILHSNEQILKKEIISLPNNNITHNYLLYMILQNNISFTYLTYLNLSHNNLRDSGGCYLLHLLTKYTFNLSYLNISYTQIGKYSIDILTKLMSSNKSPIETLNISGNNIGDSLFNDVFLSLSMNTHIKYFYSSDNSLGYLSAMMLGGTLRYDNKLLLLDISSNAYLLDESCEPILSSLIYNSKLEVLIMNNLNLTNKFLISLSKNLTKNKQLKILSIEHNNFTNRGLCLLSELLETNSTLEYIMLYGNKITFLKLKEYFMNRNNISLIKKEEFAIKFYSKNNKYKIEPLFKLIFN